MRRTLLVTWGVLLWPAVAAGWSLMVEQGKIGMALPDIRTGGWEVTGSKANVLPSITASGESAVIEFNPPSRVLTERLAYSGSEQALLLEDLRTSLSDVTLTLDYGAPGDWPERIAIEGEIRVDATRAEHPRLVPQAWSFQGHVDGRLTALRIEGTLVSEAGLEVDLDVQLNPGGAVLVSANAVIEGPEGVRSLADTVTGWPAMLTVDSGSARLSAEVRVGPEGDLDVDGRSHLEGVTGVFNRTAFSGLSGRILASLEDNRLTARFRDLTAEQVNPGIPVNALRFTGDYTAPVAKTLEGKLNVQQARARFLDGTLRVPPGVYDLAGNAGRIPVQVQDISLGRLMEVYPAEGLDGSGLISGRIPLRMLGGNQAMDVVVQALQNFHYSVLSSTIDYDETGKLTLDLRLEGKNPELRGGQPVVLNVNLEEDIPALLTSLQLSGRVNEAVTERVRELLRKSGQEAEP